MLSTKKYIELLGTYSDHIVIEETIRNESLLRLKKQFRDTGEHLPYMIELI